jgi:hypothetical protein
MPSPVKGKFKCAYCSRSFPRPAALGSHVYRAHPEHRKATAEPVSRAPKKAPATTSGLEKASGRPAKQELAKPASTVVSSEVTSSNPALTHLDVAISGLEEEVERDKGDLARLEALQRDLGKKEELLAGLIKERGKFVGQE